MKVLILGGTQFVGRHVAEALLAAGHSVSVLNRGQTPDPLPACVERLRGDRDRAAAGLSALAGRRWDACVDTCGYTPRQVRPSVELLANRVGRYVLVSAVSVYGDPPRGPVTEDFPRLPPLDDASQIDRDTYGPLKVACENIAAAALGQRCALLRPQVVAGAHDPLDRYSYWVRRVEQGGAVLAPGDGADHLQVIDARDLARFAVTVIERSLSGAFNLAGPRITWAEFLRILGAPAVVWVPANRLRAAGVTEFELPLFRPAGGPRSNLMHVSAERALAAGLTLSDPRETAAAVRARLPGCGLSPALAPHREAELLRPTPLG